MSSPEGAAGVIAELLKAHAGLDLPVGLRAWDGSEAGPEGPPVLVARTPRALRRILWCPGELGLARAYISGDLDVEGDLTDGLRRVWGAISQKGAPTRGITLTPAAWTEQGGYVRERARGLGLGDRAAVRIQDYRDPVDERYDAIASVEMGEHVGAAQYPRFCEALYGRLRPGGRLLIQQMFRDARAPGGGPFIESYVAPDMDMRPVGETVRLIENAGFEVIGVEAMRNHYMRTIQAWLDNFEQNLPAIKEILSEEQVRVWRLYLAGGALAFEEGRMGVDQILAVRSAPARSAPARSTR